MWRPSGVRKKIRCPNCKCGGEKRLTFDNQAKLPKGVEVRCLCGWQGKRDDLWDIQIKKTLQAVNHLGDRLLRFPFGFSAEEPLLDAYGIKLRHEIQQKFGDLTCWLEDIYTAIMACKRDMLIASSIISQKFAKMAQPEQLRWLQFSTAALKNQLAYLRVLGLNPKEVPDESPDELDPIAEALEEAREAIRKGK